jgi:hypothetical protein
MYAHMFPDHDTHLVHPWHAEEHLRERPTDLCLIHTTALLDDTTATLRWARALTEIPLAERPVVALLGSDPPGGWLHWGAATVEVMLALMSTVDVVCERVSGHVGMTEALTDTPVEWVREPSNSATYVDHDTDPSGRYWLLVPRAVSNQGVWSRAAVLNYAVAKRVGEILPPVRLGVIHSWGLDINAEMAVQRELGVLMDLSHPGHDGAWGPWVPTEPEFREHLGVRLRKARAVVNLDMTTAVGHWQVDTASYGVPAVVGGTTGAGPELYGSTTVWQPHDVKQAVELVVALFADDGLWLDVSRAAKAGTAPYAASAVGARFSEVAGKVREGAYSA